MYYQNINRALALAAICGVKTNAKTVNGVFRAIKKRRRSDGDSSLELVAQKRMDAAKKWLDDNNMVESYCFDQVSIAVRVSNDFDPDELFNNLAASLAPSFSIFRAVDALVIEMVVSVHVAG